MEKDPPAQLFPTAGILVGNLIIAVSMFPLALFLFSLLGRYSFFAELVCNFRYQIMLSLIPFAVFACCARRWWLSGVILAAIGWSMVGILWIYVPGFQPPPGGQTLTVMSYNVLASNYNHQQIVDQILAADPDFVSILEGTTHWQESLNALDDQYAYQVRVPRWHGFGVAMFSKYPLEDTEVIQLTKTATDCPLVVSNVRFGDQVIRMAAIHVVSPTSRLRLKLRNEQFIEVAEIISGTDRPTVLMGDFNCTPWSSFLRDFVAQSGLRDSRRGFGCLATWPADKWILRIPIDHAFVSDQVHVHERGVGARSASDHLPILFEISTAVPGR